MVFDDTVFPLGGCRFHHTAAGKWAESESFLKISNSQHLHFKELFLMLLWSKNIRIIWLGETLGGWIFLLADFSIYVWKAGWAKCWWGTSRHLQLGAETLQGHLAGGWGWGHLSLAPTSSCKPICSLKNRLLSLGRSSSIDWPYLQLSHCILHNFGAFRGFNLSVSQELDGGREREQKCALVCEFHRKKKHLHKCITLVFLWATQKWPDWLFSNRWSHWA